MNGNLLRRRKELHQRKTIHLRVIRLLKGVIHHHKEAIRLRVVPALPQEEVMVEVVEAAAEAVPVAAEAAVVVQAEGRGNKNYEKVYLNI